MFFIITSVTFLFFHAVVRSIRTAHEIIPKDILEAEINHRVNCWVHDTSGRRDFSHLYHIEVRKWEMKKKADMKILYEQEASRGCRNIFLFFHSISVSTRFITFLQFHGYYYNCY